MALKNLKKFIKTVKTNILLLSKKRFTKMNDLVVKRAKRKHPYQDISGKLTESHRWDRKMFKTRFYTIYYGKWVVKHYNENWVKKSVDYYTKNQSKWRK